MYRNSALTIVAIGLAAAGLSACHSTSAAHAAPLGKKVSVGFYPDSGATPTTTLDVSVTGVRKGTQDEMRSGGFDLDHDQKLATPYYVDVSYRNTGSVVATNPPGINGDGDGYDYSALVVVDLGGPTYAPCPGTPASVAPSATATGCDIIMVPKGATLDRISYLSGGAEGFKYWKAHS